MGQSGQAHAFETWAPEIEPRLAMSIDEPMNVPRQLQTRSHALTSVASPEDSCNLAVATSIAPVCGLIFTQTTDRPAATTPLTALVKSRCRKLEGARVTSHQRFSSDLPKIPAQNAQTEK